MDEHQWLTDADPERRLRFLRDGASERKLRLFACACWRLVWHLVRPGPERDAVETAERFADGRATGEELAAARRAALGVASGWGWTAAERGLRYSSWRAGQVDDTAGTTAPWWDARARAADAHRVRCLALLREVFGNPFRPARLPRAVFGWEGGTAVKLAGAIYEERAFERLPILGDALEEAGCADADVLAHCRGEGPHVRGCWVLDLLLGRR